MKRRTIFTAAVLAVFVFAIAGDSLGLNMHKAESEKRRSTFVSPDAIKNFERGIKSENDGLKKSSIYFAGVYKINELVKPLLKQLSIEKDNETKTLIALALYMIGDKEGIAAIQEWQYK